MPLILPRRPQRYLSGLSVHPLPTPSSSCPHRPRRRRRCSRPLLGTFSPRYISVVSGLPLSSSNGPSSTVGGVLRRLSTPHRSRRHQPCSRPLLGTFPAQRTLLILGHPFSSSVYPVVCCRWLATRLPTPPSSLTSFDVILACCWARSHSTPLCDPCAVFFCDHADRRSLPASCHIDSPYPHHPQRHQCCSRSPQTHFFGLFFIYSLFCLRRF